MVLALVGALDHAGSDDSRLALTYASPPQDGGGEGGREAAAAVGVSGLAGFKRSKKRRRRRSSSPFLSFCAPLSLLLAMNMLNAAFCAAASLHAL